MAGIEADLGISSTYYFRSSPSGRFPEKAISAIRKLGHETGYHYECLSRCNGVQSAAMELFQRDLDRFRQIAPCTTVAMHGAPLSPHHNGDLLKTSDLTEYGLVGDAVLSFADRELYYMTDTGGRWMAPAVHNRRDRVGRSAGAHPAPDTREFADWLETISRPVYISTHPERWTRSPGGYLEARFRDVLVNFSKQLIASANRRFR